jgi:coenzyme F420-reducing hydrogenase gamma subunit
MASIAPPTAAGRVRPRLGVVKFASCDGCQLSLLDMQDDVLALAERIDIVEFPEASSSRSAGPYDLLLVEGSVSTPDQAEEIKRMRAQARMLVTIGACAETGGVQALRNWMSLAEVAGTVYPRPADIDSLEHATPVSEHVNVDLELPGCPVSTVQLREVVASVLLGRRPQLPNEAVCLDCKRRGITCVLVTGTDHCLGPVTRTGCGALCPSVGRGCFGCFGPRENANPIGLASGGRPADPAARELPMLPIPLFTAWAEAWRESARPAAATDEDPTDARH